MPWPDDASQRDKNLLALLPNLTELLEGTEFFPGGVLPGFPQDYFKSVYKDDIATLFFKAIDHDKTQGLRNKPAFVYSTIGLLASGTQGDVHLRIVNNALFVRARFDNQSDNYSGDWATLSGAVHDTEIVGFDIYPEKSGTTMTTSAVIQLKHDVRW